MNYLGASPRGIKKANAQGESGTDPRVGVLNQKENKKTGLQEIAAIFPYAHTHYYFQSSNDAADNIIETKINITGSGSAFECWYNGMKIKPGLFTIT